MHIDSGVCAGHRIFAEETPEQGAWKRDILAELLYRWAADMCSTVLPRLLAGALSAGSARSCACGASRVV